MATEKAYVDGDFTSRTGPKDTYLRFHEELEAGAHDIKSIKQNGDGCTVYLNSDLVDWSAIDTVVTNHTAEEPV